MMFFFEKKHQKTFIRLVPRRSVQRGAHVQKFFASFFQKRSPFFLFIPRGIIPECAL
jgi:hypothetical protein